MVFRSLFSIARIPRIPGRGIGFFLTFSISLCPILENRMSECKLWEGKLREGFAIKNGKSVHALVSGLKPTNGRWFLTTCGNGACIEKEHIFLWKNDDGLSMIRPIVRRMFEGGFRAEEIASFVGIGQTAVKNILRGKKDV